MNPQTITVAPHDTLTGIANSNKTTVQALLGANPSIKNPDLIFSGSTLNLPGAPAPTVAPGTGVATGTTAPPAPAPAAPVADPNADPDAATKEAVAKELGYTDFNSFAQDTLQKPALDTEKLYNDAYSAQGLGDILKGITDKKAKLNDALGVVNDNPWYDEAFRRGEAARLQTLAGTDIKNSEDLYNLKLGQVHDLVTRNASDFTANESANNAKLSYLHNIVSAAQTARQTAATAAAKPIQTVSVGTNGKLYSVDPVTHEFKLVATGNAPVTKPKNSTPPVTPEEKIITAFNKAAANRTALTKAGTREQFARQLQAQYPQISPADIQRKVYEIYPDHFDGK